MHRYLFRSILSRFFTMTMVLAFSMPVSSAEQKIAFPKPQLSGGKSLMESLSLRKSTRELSNKPLTEQQLGDLLWATWGINRDDGKRTAPSAKNNQDVIVFIALESGVWRYEAKTHGLVLALKDNTLPKFGKAAAVLLYAAPKNTPTSGFHVGSLYQNAGLYCASVDLGNIVRLTGADALDGQLELPEGYQVFIAQSVGWPL